MAYNVLISWDCNADWCLELTQNGAKKYPVRSSSAMKQKHIVDERDQRRITRLLQAKRKVLKYSLFTTVVCRKRLRINNTPDLEVDC